MLTGQGDVLAVVGIVLTALVVGTLLHLLQRTWLVRVARPHLPAADRAPAGLGRLVPVGTQVEEEYRRGVVALEHWLLSHRQAGRGGA